MTKATTAKALPTNGVFTRHRLIASAVAVLLFFFGGWIVWSALPGQDAQAKTSSRLPEGIGFEQRLDATVPTQLTFTDEEGRPLNLAAIMNDQPILLNLVYFQCPMLCQFSMDGLVRTLNTMKLRVGQDFQVLTISFDPREGPALAAAAKHTMTSRYTSDHDSAGWHFLTGDEEAIAKITDAVGFGYKYDEQTGQFAHAAGIVVLTPEGRISRYLAGVDFAARDLRLSLVEASAGRIGSVTDQALLLCYRYDPLTGRYGLAILRAIQFSGILTVVAIGVGITWALRRERRSNHRDSATTGTIPNPSDVTYLT